MALHSQSSENKLSNFMSAIRSIGVVGAGTMGNGIAQVFAQAGFNVYLQDTVLDALDRARTTIDANLGRLVSKNILHQDERDATLERLSTVRDLGAFSEVDYIVEAIIENTDAKKALFTALDSLVDSSVILASNTSSISISTLAATTARPDRVLGMHFMNPAPLMPLVELVKGQHTSQETMAAAVALCDRLEKTAVESADRPGFIANRILMPMINEAIYALMDNVGTAEAIDTVMKLGMKHPMGPLALADLIGLDVCLDIMQVLHEGFADDKYQPCPLLRKMVKTGTLGRKTGAGFYNYS
jgi:3-hydroxybutyryl-CoA dehydrogenase